MPVPEIVGSGHHDQAKNKEDEQGQLLTFSFTKFLNPFPDTVSFGIQQQATKEGGDITVAMQLLGQAPGQNGKCDS